MQGDHLIQEGVPFGSGKPPQRLDIVAFGDERQVLNERRIVAAEINPAHDQVTHELMPGEIAEQDGGTGGRWILLEPQQCGASIVGGSLEQRVKLLTECRGKVVRNPDKDVMLRLGGDGGDEPFQRGDRW